VIEDRALARHRPELAALSSLAHAREEQNFDLLRTALDAVAHIDEDLRSTYTTILLDAAGEALRNKLEREMNLGSYPEPTDLEKRILARGEARGEARGKAIGVAEGEARGKAEAILSILGARGLEVPEALRERVLGCADLEQLESWLLRALHADAPDDIFASH